jgi:hypothetical protein
MRPHVPDLKRCVLRTSNEQSGVGRKGALVNWRNMATESIDEFAISCIPDLGVIVERGRCYRSSESVLNNIITMVREAKVTYQL